MKIKLCCTYLGKRRRKSNKDGVHEAIELTLCVSDKNSQDDICRNSQSVPVDCLTKVESNGRIKKEEDKGYRTFKEKKFFAPERPSPNVKQHEVWNEIWTRHEQWV